MHLHICLSVYLRKKKGQVHFSSCRKVLVPSIDKERDKQ